VAGHPRPDAPPRGAVAAIATVTALFTGMVLSLQTSYSLAAYGAKLFVGTSWPSRSSASSDRC